MSRPSSSFSDTESKNQPSTVFEQLETAYQQPPPPETHPHKVAILNLFFSTEFTKDDRSLIDCLKSGHLNQIDFENLVLNDTFTAKSGKETAKENRSIFTNLFFQCLMHPESTTSPHDLFEFTKAIIHYETPNNSSGDKKSQTGGEFRKHTLSDEMLVKCFHLAYKFDKGTAKIFLTHAAADYYKRIPLGKKLKKLELEGNNDSKEVEKKIRSSVKEFLLHKLFRNPLITDDCFDSGRFFYHHADEISNEVLNLLRNSEEPSPEFSRQKISQQLPNHPVAVRLHIQDIPEPKTARQSNNQERANYLLEHKEVSEAHPREIIDLLFSRRFTLAADGKRLIDCLYDKDFDAINFSLLSQYKFSSSDAAQCFAQQMFFCLTESGISLSELNRFTKKLLTSELMHRKEALKGSSLIKPFILQVANNPSYRQLTIDAISYYLFQERQNNPGPVEFERMLIDKRIDDFFANVKFNALFPKKSDKKDEIKQEIKSRVSIYENKEPSDNQQDDDIFYHVQVSQSDFPERVRLEKENVIKAIQKKCEQLRTKSYSKKFFMNSKRTTKKLEALEQLKSMLENSDSTEGFFTVLTRFKSLHTEEYNSIIKARSYFASERMGLLQSQITQELQTAAKEGRDSITSVENNLEVPPPLLPTEISL